jgi:LysM repeat protein
MKISKVFGFVLCLHLGVIAVLIVQPGCGTTQPPTQTYQQNSAQNNLTSSRVTPTRTTNTNLTVQQSHDGLIPATRVDAGGSAAIDPAFNSGFDTSSDGRYAPNRPAVISSEFGEEVPRLQPVASETVVSTVDIAGPSFQSYTIKKGDNLWALSKRYNVSLNELYAANGLNKNSVLKIGQQIQIPVEGSTASVTTVTADTYQPSGFNMSTESYTVRGGDNLSKIAVQYNTSVRAIKAANNKTSDVIQVGEELIIPVGASSSSTTTSSSSLTAPKASTSVSTVTVAPTINAAGTHTVKAGEYPATIARQYGMTTSELLAINGITDPRKMQIGQQLKVSTTGSAANVATKTETVAPKVSTSSTTYQAPSVSTVSAASNGPVAIRVVEADPLVEDEVLEIDTDAMFENAVEIPVIRLDDQ